MVNQPLLVFLILMSYHPVCFMNTLLCIVLFLDSTLTVNIQFSPDRPDCVYSENLHIEINDKKVAASMHV